MQKTAILILCLMSAAIAWSQSKPLSSDPTKWSMEDMKRFAAMTPAQQEAFKKKMLQQAEGQLKQMADAGNIKLDETILPATQLKPPVKDIKKLSSIPVNPPTRQQLLQDVAKMEMALKTVAGPQAVQKVDEFSASRSTKEIQSAAVGGWYGDNPQAALLLGMKAAIREPSSITGWNNLAAMLNLSGLQHKAIPILQHCLQQLPNNSMLLNNMGQAYFGLGELTKAKQFLGQCLSMDELNPEANHSMAMLYIFDNDWDNALKHFEKEMQVAQRRSSLAQLVKSGHRDRINLARLRKQKMQLDGVPSRDFFSEISLEKFKIPDPPANSKASPAWKEEHKGLFQSIAEEMLFWMQAGQPTEEQTKAEGKKHFGIYHDLVDELIRDLGDQYIPLFAYITEDDIPYLNGLHYDYTKKDNAIKCPDGPDISVEAYNKMCCDLKTPPIDDLMNKYNSFISVRIKEAQSNYKQYINGLISIVQLDPSLANKMLVYRSVGNYFAWLGGAIGAYLVKDPYMTCYDNRLTSEAAAAQIQSARNINLECPSWLKLELSVSVAKMKADCEGYNIEADVYKLLQVGAEKKFKTGTSTLYVGAGIDGSFKGVASGSISQQFYVVFDHNNQFADLGMRGGASGELGGGIIGAEFGYDFGMNSGFNGQHEFKSGWLESYEKALNVVTK